MNKALSVCIGLTKKNFILKIKKNHNIMLVLTHDLVKN